MLSCAVRDVFDNTCHSAIHAVVNVNNNNRSSVVDDDNGGSSNNDNDSNMNINISLQAKPEWRRHFPLNALLRPSINSFAHDQFHMPQQKKKQRRSTLSVTELRNATVVTHHPRIVNEATGERAMCAVESEVTRARNLEVAVLDAGLMDEEEVLL